MTFGTLALRKGLYGNRLTRLTSSIAVKDEVIDDFNVYAQEFLKGTVWASGCRSWSVSVALVAGNLADSDDRYKNGKVDGKVTAMYSGSVLHYKGKFGTAAS